jgi:hypothetical protein
MVLTRVAKTNAGLLVFGPSNLEIIGRPPMSLQDSIEGLWAIWRQVRADQP